ncbi:hypothetical protein SUGI_0203820 [Cryptomeria japonica]|nr:hypothetical protein SUGI_0203820 [Cryptomeria japonica]
MSSYIWQSILSSLVLFVLAGICEIGGGWFVWKWRKEGWHWGFFILGSLILILYGILPTLQTQDFGRTYAAYGGFFIALSLLWGWAFDSQQPDGWDILGAAVAVVGVCIVMFAPRNSQTGQ